jgi:hypothetical protein
MRIHLLIAAAICTLSAGLSAQNNAIERYFEKYTDDERFTVVFISPKAFEMVAKIETTDPEWNNIRPIIKDLTGLRVLACDSLVDGVQMYKEALAKVPQQEYSELLTVRDGQENVRIWSRDKGNIIEELLLLVGSPDEFVLLSLTGKIDLDKISELSNTLDVQGLEHLDKLEQH